MVQADLLYARKPLTLMMPREALKALGFVRGALWIEHGNMIYASAPDIPCLTTPERTRWLAYWNWLESGVRAPESETVTFPQHCYDKGICFCMHGDCAHDHSGCTECDCSMYSHLTEPPAEAIAFLTSGNVLSSHMSNLQNKMQTQQILNEAQRRLLDAQAAERRVAEQTAALKALQAEQQAVEARAAARLAAARSGVRFKNLDVDD